MVFPQKMLLFSAVGSNLGSGKSEEALGHILGIHLPVLREGVQIAVDLLDDPVPFKQGLRDKQGILQIHLILFVIAVVCKFGIAGQGQVPGPLRMIGDGKRPDLIGFSEGDVISGFRANPAVVGGHYGIAHAVAAFVPAQIQRLADGLPGGGPVVGGVVVPEVEVAPRLVEAVENVTEDPAVRAGFCKAVASRIVRNDGAVFRGAQVVDPGGRGVRAGDHIFSVQGVKVSVVHRGMFPFFYVV